MTRRRHINDTFHYSLPPTSTPPGGWHHVSSWRQLGDPLHHFSATHNANAHDW